MARFNPDFWEIQTGPEYIDRISSDRALWYETDIDRERRYALQDFYGEVAPVVSDWIATKLTKRQQQVLNLYFFQNKTQEDIAAELNLTQSTVSRHLFGTARNGRKVGGAIPKLRKVAAKTQNPRIHSALDTLQARFELAV